MVISTAIPSATLKINTVEGFNGTPGPAHDTRCNNKWYHIGDERTNQYPKERKR